MSEHAELIVDAGTANPRTVAGASRLTFHETIAIDRREPIIEFAQSRRGRLLIVTLFTLLLIGLNGWPMSIACGAAALSAYVPRFRGLATFVASFALLPIGGLWFSLDSITAAMTQERIAGVSAAALAYTALIAFVLVAWLTLSAVRRDNQLFVARRPVLTLLAIEAVLCGLACMPFVHGWLKVGVWAFLAIATPNMWFFAYALVDQRSRAPGPMLHQLGLFHPFWGSTSTPWGKGAAFLRKAQSTTRRDIAVTQLKAVKLLIWSCILLYINAAAHWIGMSVLRIPTLEGVQAAYFQHRPYPIAMGWIALVLDVVFSALALATAGHQAIAVARLAGYRLPRNTWRPLESRSLADFWNRYYYYFKELLVDFFFLPTFLRTFRQHPRLRIFFATFMAAGVGNAIYHFVRDIGLVAVIGLKATVETFTSYAFYCVVLAVGIGISQVRSLAGRRGPRTRSARVAAFVGIWLFIICLHPFGNETRFYTLEQRITFMASLFGVD
ncbi:hypothetical protein [Paraburkholderia sp. ZP32-5]|uniref:hypothetical protein n=1 Tax=Paraburkholderia sp. ZP32-5 TaxID=2883245 RepID=UPI001F3202DC|nr:hypothetical protein [Paraburkholderia sp. ZP32-5]